MNTLMAARLGWIMLAMPHNFGLNRYQKASSTTVDQVHYCAILERRLPSPHKILGDKA